MPPENVDSSSAHVRWVHGSFLPVFCPSQVRKWNFLLNQCLGLLTQRFSTGLLPKNVDILTMIGDKCHDHVGGSEFAQRLRAAVADGEKTLKSMAWPACQAFVHKLAPEKCG
ncbi:hypothetical protein Hsc_3126 [Herbaspirillum seropedicae]|nr:hypothetical protein Hsc_3126 [Herbaspirillum seropedicae]